MIRTMLEKLARQVFHDDGDSYMEEGYTEYSELEESQSVSRTLRLITPVEHDSLASLSFHIASSAKGEVFTPGSYSPEYVS